MAGGRTNVGGNATILGSASVDTTGWVTTTAGGFNYYRDITISGVTSSMQANVFFPPDASYTTAYTAQIGACDAISGGIRVYSMKIPTATITMQYIVYRS